MRQMTRALRWSHFCVLALGALVACSGGASSSSGDQVPSHVKCGLDTRSNYCVCSDSENGQLAGRTVVNLPICGAAPSGETWECCADLDSNKQSSWCDCKGWVCLDYGGNCECGFGWERPPGVAVRTSCTGVNCFKRSDYECACSDDPNAVIVGDERVKSCVQPTKSRCEVSQWRGPTCAGLDWKPPPPPSTGGCIRNGNACGPSNTFVGACCSGFCGRNGTCE